MKIRRVYICCQSKFMQCGKFRMLIFFFSLPSQRIPLGLNTGHKVVVRGQRKSEAPYDFPI